MVVSVRRQHKVYLILIGILVIAFYGCIYSNFFNYGTKNAKTKRDNSEDHMKIPERISRHYFDPEDYNVWLIFTKVYVGSPLTYKFKTLIDSLITTSSVPLNLNIIVDNTSEKIAENLISKQMIEPNKNITHTFYNIISSAKSVEDVVDLMTNVFSKPGSYYSDVLFYISLGLHRIAPVSQKYAILLDCDIYFKKDIALLFDQFKRFKDTALFGIAPELTPVYRHVMRSYRMKHPNTTLGDYYRWNDTINPNSIHPHGFQGYNSGVLLLKLDSIRNSKEYASLLTKNALDELTKKYDFKQGHLGDQDFYTLLGCEYPHLIQTIHCGFNRQLCTWWRDNGYRDVFDYYARCDHEVVILHGNCNTEISV